MRQRRPRHVHRSHQCDLELASPGGRGFISKGADLQGHASLDHPRVVHDYVEASEAINRGLDEPRRGYRISEVCQECMGIETLCRQFGRSFTNAIRRGS